MQCNIQTLLQKTLQLNLWDSFPIYDGFYLKHWPTFDECMPTIRFWASAKNKSKKFWCSRIEEQVLSKRSKPEISWNWQTSKQSSKQTNKQTSKQTNTNQQTSQQTQTNKQANIICLCSNQYARHMSENIMEVDIKPESFRNPATKSRRSNKIRAICQHIAFVRGYLLTYSNCVVFPVWSCDLLWGVWLVENFSMLYELVVWEERGKSVVGEKRRWRGRGVHRKTVTVVHTPWRNTKFDHFSA